MTEIGHTDHHDADEEMVPLPHRPRRSDTDPRAASRAERQVAMLFVVSSLATLGFLVAYFAVDVDTSVRFPVVGQTNLSNLLLGLTLGLALLAIGIGAIHWAKRLMPDVEVIQSRHPIGTSEEDLAITAGYYLQGAEASGIKRRPLIRNALIGALGLVGLPGIAILADLGPLPGKSLTYTLWGAKKGTRILIAYTNQPLRPSDFSVGSLVNAVPDGVDAVMEAEGNLDELAKSAIILVRMDPSDIVSQQGEGWDFQGILAFSKICTHVGCPINLYEQQTHHLLCPCHQSTFDLADGGNVIFGPAARALPQLQITVDADGYLIAPHDFTQPVGPSFWERG